MADIVAARFNNPGHAYPEMVQAGLAELWVGPKRNDFHPRLILAVCKHLEKHERPHERGDAINATRNRVLQADWGWLEQRWEEAEAFREKMIATGFPAEPPPLPPCPRLFSEMTPEEQQAAREAIERARPRRSLKNSKAIGGER